jgi:hypothetical protein
MDGLKSLLSSKVKELQKRFSTKAMDSMKRMTSKKDEDLQDLSPYLFNVEGQESCWSLTGETLEKEISRYSPLE